MISPSCYILKCTGCPLPALYTTNPCRCEQHFCHITSPIKRIPFNFGHFCQLLHRSTKIIFPDIWHCCCTAGGWIAIDAAFETNFYCRRLIALQEWLRQLQPNMAYKTIWLLWWWRKTLDQNNMDESAVNVTRGLCRRQILRVDIVTEEKMREVLVGKIASSRPA